MRQLLPAFAPVDDPDAVYDRIVFPEPPADRARVYVNMVSSADGRAQVDGRAAGLGSPLDQQLMRRLRALADCVVNGSGTLSADQVYIPTRPELAARRRERGQAPEPLWAVFTASGRISSDLPLLRKPPPRPIVFAAEATPRRERDRLAELADVRVVGDERPDPAEALRVLRHEYGCRQVLCEGGPTLNGAMLAAGLVDELFLTLAPKLVAGSGKSIVSAPQFPRDGWPELEIVSLFEHADELFFRYRVRPG